MKVVRAREMGVCFGVRDAIELALAEARDGPLTVLGDLVHNESVLNSLEEAGVRRSGTLAGVSTRRVMITAHGTSDLCRFELYASGRDVLDATCPLVRQAHERLRHLVSRAYHPVVIGVRGHVEVEGLIGDFPGADVVLSGRDVEAMEPWSRLGVVAQTTQPIDRVRHLVALIRARFPASDVRFEDTVCRPTKDRQQAAEELARAVDVVVVVGGAASNNTRELAETCRRFCERVHRVVSAGSLRRAWFGPEDIVGLTAGTSTPEWIIEAVEQRLEEWAVKGHPREPAGHPCRAH
jgi:4-hydroxy-3-methylbut-2-enyl diphosphate reductase